MSNPNRSGILAIVVVWAIVLAIDSIICTLIGLDVDAGFYLCMVIALIFIVFVTHTDVLNQ